mgnify:CR=1 FL=1
MQAPADVDHNIAWLRSMRDVLGWSTPTIAEKAKEFAELVDHPLKLSQQSVSAFENGKVKNTPRWLGFVQLAMLDEFEERGLDHEELFDLRLPKGSARYFESRRAIVLQNRKWNGFPDEERKDSASKPAPPRDDMVEVAMVDLAYGMGGTFLAEHPDSRMEEFPLSFLRNFTKADPGQLMIAEGVGDSMAPTIGPSDLVLIDRGQNSLNVDDRIWACAIGEIGMIKRLRVRGDTVTLLSDNANVPEDRATDGELHLIGRVVGKFSRL